MQSRRIFLQTIFAGAALSAFGAEDAITVALVMAPGTNAFQAGIDFGVAEAAHTATLMRRTFRVADSGATMISVGPASQAQKLAAARRAILAIVTDGGDDGAAWRINPTAAARATAVARLAPGDAAARALAWHPTLTRYGAGELNERFRTRTGKPMDEAAWFGWIAVKIALETSLRKNALAAARVDGHKGVVLRFNQARELEQPLYVVTKRNGREVVLG